MSEEELMEAAFKVRGHALAEFNPAMKIIALTISGRTLASDLRDLLPRPTQGILESFYNVQAAD